MIDLAEANKLAEENLPLCRYLAKRFITWGRHRGLDYEDLFGIAQLAMIKASRTYDPQEGTFGTWAGWYIRGAFHAAANRRRPIQLSDGTFRRFRVEDPESIVPLEWADRWRDLLSFLDSRSRRVIELRFLEGLKLAEVAAQIGVCTERARQIQIKALAKLREMGQQTPEQLEEELAA